MTDTPPIDWDEVDAIYDAARKADVTGDTATATVLYRQLLTIDPDDHLGVILRLSRLDGTLPEKAPDAYVATLFDQVAERFEAILVDQLGYAVPLMISQMLTERGVPASNRWLDLGCGTGLCAMALEDQTAHRVGVDLAPTMVEIASELDLYQELATGEIVEFLVNRPIAAPFDLVTAADVLPYVGALEPLLAALGTHVSAGSHFVFSTEALGEDSPCEGFALGEHKRFAHKRRYYETALNAHGWTVEAAKSVMVRLEQEEPVMGDLVLARKH
ncbi:MAG: methyltransferase domain-containing protein [Pseudomonadota bacterium]